MYSKKEKKGWYYHTDPTSISASTWKKEKLYQSRRYTPSVTTNWKSSIDTSNKTKKADGF